MLSALEQGFSFSKKASCMACKEYRTENIMRKY
jgi:hypothetical protein